MAITTPNWTTEPNEFEDIANNNLIISLLERGIGSKWLKYLYDRKLEPDTIHVFKLGAYNTDDAIRGTENVDTGTYPLRGRLIIPIYDSWDVPVSLVGRAYPKSSFKSYAKYLPISYPKGNYLYNLNNAKSHIIKKQFAFVVEGFFDVFTLWQQGIKNVVCTQGTSISKRQASLLRRYTNTIGYIPDNDKPNSRGQIAGEEGYIRIKGVLEHLRDGFTVEKIENTTSYEDLNDMLMHGSYDFFDWLKGFELR